MPKQYKLINELYNIPPNTIFTLELIRDVLYPEGYLAYTYSFVNKRDLELKGELPPEIVENNVNFKLCQN